MWIVIYEGWGHYSEGDWVDSEPEEFPIVFPTQLLAASVADGLQHTELVYRAWVEECPK